MNTAFKRNLVISFSISLLLLLASSITSYISIRNLLESQRLVDHTNTVIIKLENAISVMKDAETGQRGYLLTGETAFLEPYTGALSKVNRLMDEIAQMTSDNPAQQEAIGQLRNITTERYTQLQSLIDAKKLGRAIPPEDLGQGRLQMDSARTIVQQMQGREQVLLREPASGTSG